MNNYSYQDFTVDIDWLIKSRQNPVSVLGSRGRWLNRYSFSGFLKQQFITSPLASSKTYVFFQYDDRRLNDATLRRGLSSANDVRVMLWLTI